MTDSSPGMLIIRSKGSRGRCFFILNKNTDSALPFTPVTGVVTLSAVKSLCLQSGIAIGPILFIIALLAILATAIAAGSGTFSSGSQQESARTLASEIMSIGEQYRTAINRLQASGCQINKINMVPNITNPGSVNYTNASSPSDHSCDVFHLAGGGMLYAKLPDAALDTTALSDMLPALQPYAGYPVFSGSSCWTNYGTCSQYSAPAHLMLFIPFIKLAVCDQINRMVTSTNGTYDFPQANVESFSMCYGMGWCPFGNINQVMQYFLPFDGTLAAGVGGGTYGGHFKNYTGRDLPIEGCFYFGKYNNNNAPPTYFVYATPLYIQ